jgi:uncharacterized membrane protein YhiD involved in acid resistance
MQTGFDSIFALSIEPAQLIANLLVALICGLIISVSYRGTSESLNYSPTFVRSNVVLSMITALVIMVIGNNLARAFGLVGAMSIIRFRTAVKDMQDIVYIFFALAAGMAAGVGLKAIALVGTLLISLILFVLYRLRYAHPSRHQFLVQFQCVLPEGEAPYTPVFQRWSKKVRLVNMQSVGTGDLFEVAFYVELKDREKKNELMRDLNRIADVRNVRFYFDEA